MKEDMIYRQNAIDVICLSWCGCQNSDCKHHFDPEVDESYWCDGCGDVEELKNIPSAEPELDEWCTDRKEYDQELHCCPRWNRVIRETLKDAERKKGRWQITDAYPHNVYCPECHVKYAQTHWAVWEDGSLPRNFCPNCGEPLEVR